MEVLLKVMITGGSGFLGSHVAETLSQEGHQVTVFDKERSPYLRSDQEMRVGNILIQEEIEAALNGTEIIYHFAALSDLDVCKTKPYKAMEINVLGTVNLLEAARKKGVKKIIFASSIYVYSRTGSFYRVSKHACEELLEVYKEQYNLDYTILRFGTLYGTRSDESNSVYRYLKSALNDKKIKFQGSGEEIREYIHVKDASEICAKVIGGEYSSKAYTTTGHHRVKVVELLQMIQEILGGNVEISYDKGVNASHYNQTPYSYVPKVGHKIISNTYYDIGQGLIEMLGQIDQSPKEFEYTLEQ
tara:strand:+ start:144 stop:1049 length:906 start_codon:yes stop_codon:yes gene_type:complete